MKPTITEQEKDLLNEIETYHQGIQYQKERIRSAEKTIEIQEQWISNCEARLEALKK